MTILRRLASTVFIPGNPAVPGTPGWYEFIDVPEDTSGLRTTIVGVGGGDTIGGVTVIRDVIDAGRAVRVVYRVDKSVVGVIPL